MVAVTDGDACPECDAEMNKKSAAGRGRNGTPMGVTWEECPECGTVVDEFGNVSTPEDQEAALEKAREALENRLGGRRD